MASIPPLKKLPTHRDEMELLRSSISALYTGERPLEILEAGCGRKWPVDLNGVEYRLTGIDTDGDAIEARKTLKNDLDVAIVADITAVDLPQTFDVVYSSFVLEHVHGVEGLLERFVGWLKDGGLLILRVPDRDSVYGLFTRLTPYQVHVAYKRYIQGRPDAGKPGHGPYPTVHEETLSVEGIARFCARSGLIFREARSSLPPLASNGFVDAMGRAFMRSVEVATLGRYKGDRVNLTLIIEKPAATVQPMPVNEPLAAGGRI